MYMCSVVSDSVTAWAVAWQTPLSMEFSKQEYWSGWPFPVPGNLPNPGIEPTYPALAGRFLTTVLNLPYYTCRYLEWEWNTGIQRKRVWLPQSTKDKVNFSRTRSIKSIWPRKYTIYKLAIVLAFPQKKEKKFNVSKLPEWLRINQSFSKAV